MTRADVAVSTPQPLVRVQDLGKRFGDLDVFTSVSFDIQPGEILGLIGPNGAGKTTLLQCLAGLLPADNGAVLCGGQSRRDLLFYMPDDVTPYGELFAGDVMAFFVGAFGVDSARSVRIRQQLELTLELEKRMSALSRGNLKRFLLALAWMSPHRLLLLDEPFGGLDVLRTRAVMDLLRQMRATGRTLMLAIHELAHAEQICDRLLLLANGRLVGAGSLAELRSQAGFAEGNGNLEEVFVALSTRVPEKLFSAP